MGFYPAQSAFRKSCESHRPVADRHRAMTPPNGRIDPGPLVKGENRTRGGGFLEKGLSSLAP